MDKNQLLDNISSDVLAKNPELQASESLTKGTQSQKGNKYHVAEKTDRTYNGKVYRSKKEAEYAADLDLRVKAGDIEFWLYEVPFHLPGNSVYKLDFMTFKVIPVTPEDTGLQGRVIEYIEYIEVKG